MFPTIQMADLQQLVRTDQIRWFDCRYDLQQPEYGRNAFLEQHVEGAQHLDLTIDLSGPLEEVGGRHPLPSKEAWQQTLEQHGVTPEDFVVLYDDGFPYAARAWWLFKWIGHERVVVLEGGFSSYLAFDLPVTDDVPTYPPSHYSPRFQDEMLVSFDDLKDQLIETMVIDSRAPDRYRGEIEPLDHVAGHIPGAVNCYFEKALSPEGRLRDAEDLKELYADILPVTAPILYCGSGVTACVNVIALHSLGKTDVRLYAGSYSDWVSRGEDVSRS